MVTVAFESRDSLSGILHWHRHNPSLDTLFGSQFQHGVTFFLGSDVSETQLGAIGSEVESYTLNELMVLIEGGKCLRVKVGKGSFAT